MMKKMLLSLALSLCSITGFANPGNFISKAGPAAHVEQRHSISRHHHRRDIERVAINLDGVHIRGNNIVYLRKALRQQRPALAQRDFRIRKVILVGKTRHGQGTAMLRIGDWHSDAVAMGGSPHAFSNNHPRTFDRIVMHHDQHNSKGPWQLHLRGNFKLRRLVVVLEEPRKHRRHRFDSSDLPGWIGRRF